MKRSYAVWTCWWVARRITRYLDSDPSTVLAPAELRRLEKHLRACSYCSGRARQYRELLQALRAYGEHYAPERANVERVRAEARREIAREIDDQPA